MKSHVIFIIFSLCVFLFSGCEDISKTIENNLEDNDPVNEVVLDDVSKEDVLEAIVDFREKLYDLGATNQTGLKSIAARGNEGTDTLKHSKDALVESNMNVGYDLEWLDMAVLVLNFAEAFTASSDTLGVETLFYEVLDDPSIWGWGIYDSTKVIINYAEEVLYLRVINDNLIQTFFFEYVEGDLIKIFRLFESVNINGNKLYIEDFIEKTGLSMWQNSGEYYMSSRVPSKDGGLYTIGTSDKGEKRFDIANYVINDVPLYILKQSGEVLHVEYDFKFVEVFDSFNEAGDLYLNDEIVQMPLEMNVRSSYTGDDKFVLTGSKELTGTTDSLQVIEANIYSDITYEDIDFNIDSIMGNAVISGLSYDYSQNVDSILNDLSDLLYLEY